jgi:hypothetical protein
VGAGREDGERGGVGLGRPDLVLPQLLHELRSRDHLLFLRQPLLPTHQTADLLVSPPAKTTQELPETRRNNGGREPEGRRGVGASEEGEGLVSSSSRVPPAVGRVPPLDRRSTLMISSAINIQLGG